MYLCKIYKIQYLFETTELVENPHLSYQTSLSHSAHHQEVLSERKTIRK